MRRSWPGSSCRDLQSQADHRARGAARRRAGTGAFGSMCRPSLPSGRARWPGPARCQAPPGRRAGRGRNCRTHAADPRRNADAVIGDAQDNPPSPPPPACRCRSGRRRAAYFTALSSMFTSTCSSSTGSARPRQVERDIVVDSPVPGSRAIAASITSCSATRVDARHDLAGFQPRHFHDVGQEARHSRRCRPRCCAAGPRAWRRPARSRPRAAFRRRPRCRPAACAGRATARTAARCAASAFLGLRRAARRLAGQTDALHRHRRLIGQRRQRLQQRLVTSLSSRTPSNPTRPRTVRIGRKRHGTDGHGAGALPGRLLPAIGPARGGPGGLVHACRSAARRRGCSGPRPARSAPAQWPAMPAAWRAISSSISGSVVGSPRLRLNAPMRRSPSIRLRAACASLRTRLASAPAATADAQEQHDRHDVARLLDGQPIQRRNEEEIPDNEAQHRGGHRDAQPPAGRGGDHRRPGTPCPALPARPSAPGSRRRPARCPRPAATHRPRRPPAPEARPLPRRRSA